MDKILYLLVYLIYFTTPFESVAIIPGVSIVKLITFLFLLTAIVRNVNIILPRNQFITYFLLYSIFAAFSTIWSIDKELTLQRSLGSLFPSFIVIIFLYTLIKTKSQVESIFKAYALGSSVVAIIAIYMFISGFRFAINVNDARLTVLGHDQNELSFLLSFGIISYLYLLNFTKPILIRKIIILIFLFILVFVVLSTGSRTGFGILLVIGTTLILMNLNKRRIIYSTLILIVGISFLFKQLPDSIIERLFETSEQLNELNFTTRWNIWETGWSAFQKEDAYIGGTGFQTFQVLIKNNYGISMAPHNTYLSTFIELGIIGALFYLGILYDLCKKSFQLMIRSSIFYLLLIIPLLISMFTLGLEGKRWLFIIGIIILKIWEIEIKGKSKT